MIGHDYILKITLTKAWVLVVPSVSHAVRPPCEMASVLKPDIQGGRQCWFLEGQAAQDAGGFHAVLQFWVLH